LITIVDGAHAPAHVPLSIEKLQPDFYTGACHKWMMAPKGCSFLYAHKSVQHLCDPLIVSWGYKALKPSHSHYLDYHQMIGTRDFSAFLTVPACLKFMAENDWITVRNECHDMVLANAQRFYDLLESKPISPLTNEWIGQMISIPIKTKEPEILQRTLFTEYNIEVPIMRQENEVYMRYSINAFNTIENLDTLYNALSELKKQNRL
jgi:isopenicillin-N epimerase